MHRPALWALGVCLLLLGQVRPALATIRDVCDIKTEERVVAIGDVHGAYDQLIATLQAAGLTDARGRWVGGRAILVQTGDLLDRGAHSRRVLDLLRRLQNDASRAGGAVVLLLGNHEVMRMVGDWRYVSAAEFGEFESFEAHALRERAFAISDAEAAAAAALEKRPHDRVTFRRQFLEKVPLGYIEMRRAFAAGGEYGRWMREWPVVAKVNGVVYVHGGIAPEDATLGCTAINQVIRREVAKPSPTAAEVAAMKGSSPSGPLWYRTLALHPETDIEPQVATTLQRLGASVMVIGHTIAPGFRIQSRFGGRVIQIDTGMLGEPSYPGGRPAALEIVKGAPTAIYLSGREPLASSLPPANSH